MAMAVLVGCSVPEPAARAQTTAIALPIPTRLPATSPTPNAIVLTTPKRLVFSAKDSDSSTDIYTIHVDGSSLMQLTKTGHAYQPTWSPDGEQIAFVIYRDLDTGYEIYIMNGDGAGQKRLTNLSQFLSNPNWSPSGKEIAFESDEGTILAVNVSDGQSRVLHGNGDNREPQWSPNGQLIAFDYLVEHHKPGIIGIVSAAGQEWAFSSTRMVPDCEACANDLDPKWSPDSQNIVFVSSRDGNAEIYVMNTHAAEQTNLTQNNNEDGEPAWSPDGRKIIFVSKRDGNHEVYVMNTDGSNQIRLTQNSAKEQCPVWASDSKQIAFLSERDGSTEIYVMNADGTNQKRLTNNDLYESCPMWSPR